MAYATVEDVRVRLGRPLEAGEIEIVTTRLEDVENIIRNRIPDLDDAVASGEVNEDTLVMVEADAVLRLIKNPEGYRSETDGNYSYQIDERVASGALDILPKEWALLGVKAGASVLRPYLNPGFLPEGEVDPYKVNRPYWWENFQ